MELLEQCRKTSEEMTRRLLTYELSNFSDQTCLSLAVSASHRAFIANTSCQILLTEMWMGGLRSRRYANLKVCHDNLCCGMLISGIFAVIMLISLCYANA